MFEKCSAARSGSDILLLIVEWIKVILISDLENISDESAMGRL